MDQSKQPQHGQETTTETKEQMILFQAQPDVYLQLIKDSPPTHLAHHAAYLLYFFTPLTSTPPTLSFTLSCPLKVTANPLVDTISRYESSFEIK